MAIFRLLGANTGLEEPIHSIAHAISLLGLDLVVEKIRHLPKLDELKPAAPTPGIYRCYSRALHAAWYGALFGDMTGDNIPNEMAVAALFNECGEMTLWAHAQEEMERIQALTERGTGRDQAAREVLGFTLDELSLAKRWHLPPLTIEALQPFAAFRPRAVGARLAAELAQASDHDWNSEQTLECLDLVGEYLDLASGEAAALVHGQSTALAREIRELPLHLSAISLLQVPTGTHTTRPARRDAPPVRPVQPPAPRPAAPAPHPTTHPLSKAEQQALAQSLRELKQRAGVERAMFAALNPEGNHLKIRLVIGAHKEAPIRRFEFALDRRSLFSILLTKPKGFWLHGGNRDKYLAIIPPGVREMLNPDGFFIASLFAASDHPVGILYADCQDAARLSSENSDTFKREASRISRLLGQL
ncbi:MAG: HDOD domain-containing protein [Candidatus Sedimenticola endophacoides]